MLPGCISWPLQNRPGPCWVRNEIMVRPVILAECLTRGRLSENRSIHRRWRSIRVAFAINCPRPVIVRSALVAGNTAAYSSGSVKVWTALEVIPGPPSANQSLYDDCLTLIPLGIDVSRNFHVPSTDGMPAAAPLVPLGRTWSDLVRPPTSSDVALSAAGKGVDGRDKPGHGVWGCIECITNDRLRSIGQPWSYAGDECIRSGPCRAVPCTRCGGFAPGCLASCRSRPSAKPAPAPFATALRSGPRCPGVHVWRGRLRSKTRARDTPPAHGSVVAPAHAPPRRRSSLSTHSPPSGWPRNEGGAGAASSPVSAATIGRRPGQRTIFRSARCHTERAPGGAARSRPSGRARRFAYAGAAPPRAT